MRRKWANFPCPSAPFGASMFSAGRVTRPKIWESARRAPDPACRAAEAHNDQRQWRERATCSGPGGTVRVGQDEPARKHPGRDRRGAAQRLGDRRQFRRRRQRGSPRAADERRCELCHDALPGRTIHLSRLPRFDRIPAGYAECAAGRRRGHRGLRTRARQGADAQALSEAAGAAGDPAFPLRQQDRQGERRAARSSRLPAGGERQAAAAAPDSDLGERRGDRLCRSGAGARLCLSPQRAFRSDRDDGRG